MADVVVLARREERIRVLLVRRGKAPFEGTWALPGGFVEEGERTVEAAGRELHEEAGVSVEELELLDVYDTPGRDPRGWAVSIVFVARLAGEPPTATAGDDAGEVGWFELDALPELAFDHASILADVRRRRAWDGGSEAAPTPRR